jgi:hypothetical protein
VAEIIELDFTVICDLYPFHMSLLIFYNGEG